ncbi:hypothetical protein D3C71_1564980 [compost metagenome]
MCTPLLNATVAWYDQLPAASTCTRVNSTPLSVRMRMLFGSPLPLISGVSSSVTAPLFNAPFAMPTSSWIESMLGGTAGTKLTVKSNASEGALKVPA